MLPNASGGCQYQRRVTHDADGHPRLSLPVTIRFLGNDLKLSLRNGLVCAITFRHGTRAKSAGRCGVYGDESISENKPVARSAAPIANN